MAASNENTEEQRRESQLDSFRRMVADVVGELRSEEIRSTYAAITLSEVVDQQLKALQGDGRIPGRKQRLQREHDRFMAGIDALLETSPEAFRVRDAREGSE
jgi:hypothetical protein